MTCQSRSSLIYLTRNALVAGLAIVSVSVGVQAKGKLTTKFEYYTVSGTTAAALHRNMTVPTGFFSSEKAYANISMSPSFIGTFKQGKSCRIKGFGINGKFTVRLPKLKSGTRLSRSLGRKFRGFSAYVRKHELTHRSIWTRCLRNAEARVNRLRNKSCTRLDQQAVDIVASEWQKCNIRNNIFDAREQKRLRRLPLVRAALKPVIRSKRIVRKRSINSSPPRRQSLGKAYNFN